MQVLSVYPSPPWGPAPCPHLTHLSNLSPRPFLFSPTPASAHKPISQLKPDGRLQQRLATMKPSVRWLVVPQSFQKRVSPSSYPQPWPGQAKALATSSLLSGVVVVGGHGPPKTTSSGQWFFLLLFFWFSFLPHPENHDCAHLCVLCLECCCLLSQPGKLLLILQVPA